MKRHLGLVLMAIVVLAGCKQDPFDSYPDSVKNGVPPGSQKPTPPPRILDAVLDSPGFLAFSEGVGSTYKVTVRVLNLDDKIPWKLGTLNAPKGVNYDQVSGNLTWTPPIGTTGSGHFIADKLMFRVETTSSPYAYKDFEVGYVVTKATQTPEVVRVDGLTQQVTEGERRAFKIIVKDISANASILPKLMIFAPEGFSKQNGAPFIRPNLLNPVQQGANGEWAFNFYVDGLDPVSGEPVEMSRGITGYSFMLRVFSAVGIPSQDVEGKVTAVNVARKPLVSFGTNPNLVVKAGQRLTLGFSVYTKHEDGNLAISFPNLGSNFPGATVNCLKPDPASDRNNCVVNWDVPGSAAAYTMKISALNKVTVNPGVPPTTAQTDVDLVITATK